MDSEVRYLRLSTGITVPCRLHGDAGAILNGLSEATPPTEAGTIHAPTLILQGAQDGLLTRGDQETLAAAFLAPSLTPASHRKYCDGPLCELASQAAEGGLLQPPVAAAYRGRPGPGSPP